jgi:predicted O-linked N-acetylglucosamine transferase (SPINDLY family)
MPTIPEALAIALQHHQAGRLHEAEPIYRQILSADPNHRDAWHLLGVVAYQVGNHQAGVECIQRALAYRPDWAEAHYNLGNAWRGQGKLDEAVACYQRALQLKPDYAKAHNHLGNALKDQAKLDEAVACYRRALELEPDYAEALSNLGVALHDQGKLDESVTCYRRALALKPGFAEALSNLGAALHDRGRLDESVTCYRRALELKPAVAEAHCNLGNALKDQGKWDEAVTCYRRALELKPDYAKAHTHLGVVLNNLGKLDAAVACHRRALELRPDYAEAHSNLGVALNDQGELDAAVACHRRALELKPELAWLHTNLGVALNNQGKLDESVACYHRALELKPGFAGAHNNLGNALKDQGKLDDAVASYRRALELAPDYAEAHSNLGVALNDQGRLGEAVGCYHRALELKPDYAEAHNNLGHALRDQGKSEEAIRCHRRALELKPGFAEAYSNLGNALKDQGKLDEAAACYRRALELKPDSAGVHSNLLYLRIFCPGDDAQAIFEEHRRWNRQHADPLARFIQPHSNDRSFHRRLRVGYVSPDFRKHAESFFTAPLLSAHDHQNFEIFCYADVTCPDRITARLRSCADVWQNISGLTDERVAQLVRQDKIDILVDLTMHMARNRLLVFARKPAPVQVCWLAYQGTTGLSTIDYRLTDSYIDPPGLHDHYYSEESVRLADAFWCYDPLANEPGITDLPAWDSGYITFGCLNNFCKVNSLVLRQWAQVLKAVDRSQLVLLAAEGSHRQETLDVLELEDVKPDRVTFVAKLPRAQYLELYHRIDIGLDTFPYTGQTTSLDAFWLGVPVITLVGQTAVARAGLSLLINLGLPELIAETPEQFVSIAVELTNDLPRLRNLRKTLRDRLQASPLMDAPRFARNVEAAYREMWRRWCVR